MNRFDSPAQDKYFNTYVPLPYEQVMGTVAARQAQLQREQDMLNKTYEDTQNLKYIPGTKDEQYVRDYLGKTSNVVNKYFGSDLSDPIVKQQMRSEFNNITNKQDLQNIQSSHSAWMTNQKYKAELKAQGLYDPAIDEDPANSDFTSSSGVYQYISPAYKNPRPAAETYFNNIKPTDLGTKGTDYFWQGVTKDKIKEVANAKWNDFANTSEGKLYVKKITKEEGLVNPKPEDIKRIATEYLMGVGNEFTYEDRGAATLDAQVRAAQGKKTPKPQSSLLILPGPETGVSDAKKVKKLYSSDTAELGELNTSITQYTDELKKYKSGTPEYESLKANMNVAIDRKDQIESDIKKIKSTTLPGYATKRQVIIDNYVNEMHLVRGVDEKTALAAFDEASKGWGTDIAKNLPINVPGTLNIFNRPAAVEIKRGEAAKKYTQPVWSAAQGAFENVNQLDREADRKIGSEYGKIAAKREHDNMYVIGGSGIGFSDTSPMTLTIDGKQSVSATSNLLKRIHTGSVTGQITDVSLGAKKKSKMTDITEMQKYIMASDNVSLDRAGLSVKPNGDYNFIINAQSKDSKGNNLVKTFDFKLNAYENPEATKAFINSFSEDLIATGAYTEAERLNNPSIEREFQSKKNDEKILIAPDPKNPNEVIQITPVGEDEYMLIDPEGNSSVDNNGNPAPISYEEVIMQLYGWPLRKLYYPEE